MPRKQRVTPPSRIIQIFNGIKSTGTVNGTGGIERIDYVNHDLRNLGDGDCGGPMILYRNLGTSSYGYATGGRGVGSQLSLRPGGAPTTTEPSQAGMWAQGGTAIARCAPDQPAFDAASFVAESISGGMPTVIGAETWRARTLKARNAGHEYLNVEFGWLPLVSDIRNFCNAVKNSAQTMKDLESGSNKKTRAGYAFPPNTSVSTNPGGPFYYSVDGGIGGWDDGCRYQTTSQSFGQTWFKGCFTYRLPVSPKQQTDIQRFASYADHILGVRLTPETLWNAAPWSWAIDWAVNVGDVAHNIGIFGHDSLLLQYGYVMTHNFQQTVYMVSSGNYATGSSFTQIDEWKKRFPASPYGFGLTYDGLTLSQKAILAAVGISHF